MQMQPLKFIKQMNVLTARYALDDGAGHTVILVVDYEHNRYQVESLAGDMTTVAPELVAPPAPANFADEVQRLAAGLLARKHGVNLAQREQYL